LFELLGATGLLVSDPIGLRWSDLVLDGSTPYLHVKFTPDRCDLAACLELVRRRGRHSNTDREKSRFPIFVVDGRYGISGAQPAETFTQALERVHHEHGAAVP
jgi:integrase